VLLFENNTAITIKGISQDGFNGTFIATHVPNTTNQFTYVSTVSGTATATATGGQVMRVQSWRIFEDWCRAGKEQGRKLLYTQYGCPTWASARPSDKGPYTHNGTNAEPADMSNLTNFMTDLMTRASAIGCAIDYVEVSNEVNWVHGYHEGTPLRFYSGTVAKLSEMTRIIAQAAKAVTPAVKIIAPSVTNIGGTKDGGGQNINAADDAGTYFAAMLAASDGAGGTMVDWIDYLSYHSYAIGQSLINQTNLFKGYVATAGLSALPIFNTETGASRANESTSNHQWFIHILRSAIIHKALGIAGIHFYAWSVPTTFVLSMSSATIAMQRVIPIINDMLTYGVTSASILDDGRVGFKCNGVGYIV